MYLYPVIEKEAEHGADRADNLSGRVKGGGGLPRLEHNRRRLLLAEAGDAQGKSDRMKKKWLIGVCSVCSVLLLMGTNIPRAVAVGDSVERALSFGAAVKIPFKVVDETGDPVSGAKISVGLFLWTDEQNSAKGVTDQDGIFTVRGKATDEVTYFITKEGYYYTNGKFRLSQQPDTNVKNGKWMPYGKERRVVLKRRVNPIPMFARPKWKFLSIPEINTPYGFDAIAMDWVEPLGKGKHVDILCEYKGKGLSGMNYRDGTLSLVWVDRNCGFYQDNVADAEFKSSYHADTNQSFQTAITFINQSDVHTGGFVTKSDIYLVFRIRSRHSFNGKLMGVHYGKIYLPIDFGYVQPIEGEKACFGISIYTNPTENDTNLEFLPYHSLNYPNERSKQPNIAP